VTDFVAALREELAATIKEPVTIYFDKNPGDGLLETHVVDKSLESKLRCVIFIPLVSQTYCDPKSFAWQHEFCAFNKVAQADDLGKDIKVTNGNVASRILPIMIHDLDASDKAIIEKETGGPLRGIAFVFKSAGVNRPLITTDKREDNQNRTVFRDQVNKTANAIKEIIQAVINRSVTQREPSIPKESRPKKAKLLTRIALGLFLLLIVTASYFLLGRHANDKPELVNRSIAVLPFVNMSNDPEQEYFSDGISEEILNVLAKVSELKVIGRTSSFYFKGRNEDLRVIGEKLGVAHLLEGSVRKDGNTVRITAQLIRTTDGSHLWSETYERKMENIFQLQDEIASRVLGQLRLKLLANIKRSPVRSSEVHKLLLQGRYAFNKADYTKALDYYEQAIALDSNDAYIWTALAQAHAILGNNNFDQFERRSKFVKYCAEKALALDNNSSDAHRLNGVALFFYDFKWEEARRECNVAIQLDSNNFDAWRNRGQVERALGEFDNAIFSLNKSLELNPLNYVTVSNLYTIYLIKGDYKEAEKILKRSAEINMDLAKPQFVYLYMMSNQLEKAEEAMAVLPAAFPEYNRGMMSAMILFKKGDKAGALELLKKSIEPDSTGSYAVGAAFAFIEQPDEALFWLEKGYDEKYQMFWLKTSAFLGNLRGNPRYITLLKKMNLPTN
jgi:adenylate cyclase